MLRADVVAQIFPWTDSEFLCSFRFIHINPGSQIWQEEVKFVISFRCWQVLNLSGCVLEDQKIMTMLAELLRIGNLPALRYLDLSGHFTLTNEGNAALATSLKSGRLTNLQHLGLPRCNIGDMVDAIQEGNIRQLKHLIFSGEGLIYTPYINIRHQNSLPRVSLSINICRMIDIGCTFCPNCRQRCSGYAKVFKYTQTVCGRTYDPN